MIRFDPTTTAAASPVFTDPFIQNEAVVAQEPAWRELPPGITLGSRVIATWWRGAGPLPGEIHHETSHEAHLVMVVMSTANIRLSVNGATIHDGVAMPGMFHVTEPGARVSFSRRIAVSVIRSGDCVGNASVAARVTLVKSA